MSDAARSTPPLRVLLLAESPYFGGITSHLVSIVDGFADRDDVALTVASLPGRHEDRTLVERLEQRGVPVHFIEMSNAYDVGVLGRLRALLDAHQIDVLHTHNYRATLISALARHGLPVVNTFHGVLVGATAKSRFWQAAELRAMRRHSAVIACSAFVRDWLLERGLAPERVHTVYNAYAPRPVREALSREQFGIAEDAFVVLFMGRLVEGKGVEHLIEALRDMDGAVALVAGDGPLRARLESLARDCGVEVHFAGKVRDPEAYYLLADVAALPSEMEALPMTLIEAAAHARPAVATAVGGVAEVVVQGQTGFLFEYGDIDALRAALLRLRDGELREVMGQNARARWRALFTPERMADALTGVYRAAASGRDAAS